MRISVSGLEHIVNYITRSIECGDPELRTLSFESNGLGLQDRMMCHLLLELHN
jgi:hypothetical protein